MWKQRAFMGFAGVALTALFCANVNRAMNCQFRQVSERVAASVYGGCDVFLSTFTAKCTFNPTCADAWGSGCNSGSCTTCPSVWDRNVGYQPFLGVNHPYPSQCATGVTKGSCPNPRPCVCPNTPIPANCGWYNGNLVNAQELCGS